VDLAGSERAAKANSNFNSTEQNDKQLEEGKVPYWYLSLKLKFSKSNQ